MRLVAVPFVLLEILIERGNYPAGYERWAWVAGAVFAAGAGALFFARRRAPEARGLGAVAFAFDTVLVSAWVAIYSFEPSSPVRQLLFLPVVEAALRYGRLGGALAPLASVPALAFFESEAADRLDVPFDPGHIVSPVGFQLLVGLVVGSLAARAR